MKQLKNLISKTFWIGLLSLIPILWTLSSIQANKNKPISSLDKSSNPPTSWKKRVQNAMQNVYLSCLYHKEERKIHVHAKYVRIIGELCSKPSQLKSVQIFNKDPHFEITNYLLEKKNSFSSDYISLQNIQTKVTLNLTKNNGEKTVTHLLLIRKEKKPTSL